MEPKAPAPPRRLPVIASAAILAAMFALSAWAWVRVPEGRPIPVHWGVNGQPDRYGGKGEGLLFAPFMGLFLSVLFTVIPRFDPRKLNLAESRAAFSAIWIAILLFLFAVHATLVSIALGARPSLMNDIIPPGIGALFLVIGLSMRKLKSNFIAGVRTPWTLSSETSWAKTHELAGWLFAVHGAAIVLASLAGLRGAWFIIILLGGLTLNVPVVIVYSYFAWKNDPDRGGG